MASLAAHVLTTPHSGIRRMLDLALAADDPLMLVGGDPNFTTPDHIIAAAAEAARGGATGYAPGAGLPALREAASRKARERNGVDATAEQVTVTAGGCGGLYTALSLLLEPGSELLVPDPGWSNYPAMAHVLHARAVGYPLLREEGFSLDPERLAALVTPRTRAIVLNSPGNPTGAVESAERLRAVLALAERHDLWVVSDECYDELVFEGVHVSTAALGGADRVITVFTCSKSYAMTGWRVGYVVSPAAFAEQLGLQQEPVHSCASTISQHAALAALRGPQACVGAMRDAYRERRDLAIDVLAAAGVGYVRPRGAFFLMVDIAPTGIDSWTFCRRLLEEEGVALVPGVAFGRCGEGFVRVSLAAAPEKVVEGVRRLAGLVTRTSPEGAGSAAPAQSPVA
jgi:aspartate aminotransferase